jgi:hypothetical protein
VHICQALQDPYGRTPLHVAASSGSVRTCDGIVRATTTGINMVDVFGTTALDNGRNNTQEPAVYSLILSKGGLPGDDPRCEKEHEVVKEFAERQRLAYQEQRILKVLKELPEFKLRISLANVEAAFQKFMEVC